ncbi:hypothetical protein SAMN05421736_11569 [Evansella caseinilytica]|uniref:Uncharacterized protein n=1 Tax=Evansella caseinilytica TaxID=1503961 RepID=A0A1H3TLC9_9BACI|nr:NADH:ubiquinone oxidoreductase [Evansella caseinilytica]SDZ51064.1 hypothetical protein SAMN05421736_11569 [Evansella caseinilytica]
MYQYPYPYPYLYGYPNYVYQYPVTYPAHYPHTFYQQHPIYREDHENEYTRAPQFSEKIGQYYTTPKPVTLPTGYTIPANTRIFIHNVTVTATGEELVTIVAPVPKGDSIENETIKDVPANQL